MGKKNFIIIFLLGICSLGAFAQTNGTCPVTNYINYFDPNCQSYLKTPEEIKLGQARVFIKDNAGRAGRCTSLKGIDLFIPKNRPGWAIGLAHTHRSMSNLMGGEYLSINHLLATSFQESWFMGTNGEVWDPAITHSIDKIPALGCSFGVNTSDGYFHTDANGRIFLTEIYPTRFPNDAAASPFVTSFEANVHLAMCWINGFYRIRQYGSKLDMQGFFANAADKYAGTKLTAGAYVSGQGLTDITSIVGTNRATTITAADILPYITNGAANTYAFYVSSYTKSLDTPANIVDPGYESSNHQWYDYQMAWTDVSDYIDKICPFYKEVNCAQAKANVKLVFDAQKGGSALSFRYEFSKVIDALTANFPYYEPEINSTQFTSYKCNYPCKLSYPVITYNTPLEFCEGLSVDLTTSVGTGYKYEWYKDNVLIPNSDNITYKAAASGIYKVKVTDPQGCNLETNCPVTVKVKKCSSCNMTASAVATNVKCSGYGDGKIIVTASGETGPYSYRINGGAFQLSNTFPNLKEGNYFITAYKTADTTCKGFASATISATNIIYNKISIASTAKACNKADLVATVTKNPPTSCNFTFERTSSNQYGDWPADILSVSLLANGTQELFNSSTDRKIFSTTVTVPNGQQLSVVIKNIGISAGTSGSDNWVFNIKAPDGSIVGTTAVNNGTSFAKGNTTIIQPFTASCVFTQPNFTYTWTPAANVSATTGLTTSATVNTDTYVKITAANPSVPQCPLLDSVLVKNTCVSICIKPLTKPVIASSKGISSCGLNTDFTISSTKDAGVYYLWYKDGTAIGTYSNNATASSLLTQGTGKYKVRTITNPTDAANTACYQESADFDYTVNATPATPTIAPIKNPLCTGENLTLTASSTTAGVTYTWTKPTGSTAAATLGVMSKTGVTINESGNYSVIASVNSCPSASSVVTIVNINVSPAQPTVVATKNPLCIGEGLTLTASSTTPGVTYNWTKPTGSTATAALGILNKNSVTAAEAGNYSVIASAGMCPSPASSVTTVVVNELPTVTASANPGTTICSGTSLTLTGAGADIYSWDNTITDGSPFVPTTNKTYTLTGTDANGCKNTATIDITIGGAPVAAISTTGAGLKYCAVNGATGVTLTAQPVTSATYEWFKDGASQGIASITNIFVNATAGSWTVKVSIGTCSATSTAVTVSSKALPDVSASASPSTALCLNDIVTLKGVSTSPSVTYVWDNGVTDNTAFPLDAAVKFKTYTVTGKSIDNCTNTATVTLTQKIPTAISVNPSSFTACSGDNKSLTITASGHGALTYQWLNGTTVVGTDSPTLTLNAVKISDAGTYKVKVTGECGILNSIEAVVTVNDRPVITKQPSKTGGCVGSAAALTVTATGSGTLTYQWKKASANTGPNSHILNFASLALTDAGIYTVTISNSCGNIVSDTASITTPANETPAVEIGANATRICSGNTITLTATPKQGGGNAPKFTFKDENGTVLGTARQSGTTVTTAALTASQTYTVEMLSNSTCLATGAVNPAVSTPVLITVDSAPVNVSAGTDQAICTTTYTLAASAHPNGATGRWTVKSGTGDFTDNTLYNTTLSNLALGPNEYKWTVTTGVCPEISDSVIITRTGTMTSPHAGSDIRVCEGSPVNLSSGALNTGETGKWTINPALFIITNNTQPAAIISNPTAGTYHVKWTISNGVCPDQADSLLLIIDQKPSAATLVSPDISTCGTQVNLNADTPTTGHGFWAITSGNGNIAQADSSNPTTLITGLGAGTNTLTWIVKNGVCAPGAPAILTINQVGNLTTPVITLSGKPITGTLDICKNKSYSFTANDPASGETGTWSSTGSNIGTLSGSTQTQNLVINSTGTATITWTISSSVPGCTPADATITLNISDIPASPASISGPAIGCEGTSNTQRIIDIAGATGYIWSVNGATGSSTTSAIQLTLGNSSAATVSVVAVNGCGNSAPSPTQTITIRPNLIPEIDNVIITGNGACAGAQIQIVASAKNAGTNPSFSFHGDPATTLPDTYVYNPASSENIFIVLTRDMSITDGCFVKDTASAIAKIEVHIPVTPSVSISPAKPEICSGDSQTFNAVNASTGTLQWFINNLAVATGPVFVSPATLNDNDEIKVVLTSDALCTTNPSPEASAVIKVNPVITSSVSIKNDNFKICKDADITFTALPGNDAGTNPTYQWLVNGQKTGPFTSSTFTTNKLADADLITVQMTPDAACPALIPAKSNPVQVNVIEPPVAYAGEKIELDQVQPVTLAGLAKPGYKYKWTSDNPDATITTDTIPNPVVVSKQVLTTYTFTVSVPGCTGTSSAEVIVHFNLKIKVPTGFSPNSDNNHDFLEIPNIAYYPKATVTIFNQWGQMVYKSPAPYLPWDGKHDGQDVSESTYYYIIDFNEKDQNPKVGYITLLR